VEELELYELQPVLQPVSKPTPAKRKGAEAPAPALITEEEEPYITTAVPGADEGAAKRHAAGKGSKSKVAAAPKDSRQAQRPSSSAEEEVSVCVQLLMDGMTCSACWQLLLAAMPINWPCAQQQRIPRLKRCGCCAAGHCAAPAGPPGSWASAVLAINNLGRHVLRLVHPALGHAAA
jgi:hypothetical protein